MAALLVLVLVLLAIGAVIFARNWDGTHAAAQQQASIQDFYAIPNPLPSETPGTLIRTEAMSISVPGGGTAYRILYVSQLLTSEPAVSSGMIFVPNTPAPAAGRKVVAWAHGTLGFGDDCTPSRSQKPLGDMTNWLNAMMQRGWVVAATDYVGIGTKGNPYYLVGKSEAADVLNSVRAARNFDQAAAGNTFAVWGHSQGGHSALWTGHLAARLAPELTLLGAAAAAPAANLVPIMAAQWRTTIGWVIGPQVSVSWPNASPGTPLQGVLSRAGLENYQRLADECVKPAGLEGAARDQFGQTFFAIDPTTQAQWSALAKSESVPPMSAAMPVFMAQGTADEVVLPGPNALLQDQWCAAGSTITVLWMGGIGHMAAATTAGPDVVPWIADRFAGRPAGRTCTTPPPVVPSTP